MPNPVAKNVMIPGTLGMRILRVLRPGVCMDAIAQALIPARRALRVDPIIALRCE